MKYYRITWHRLLRSVQSGEIIPSAPLPPPFDDHVTSVPCYCRCGEPPPSYSDSQRDHALHHPESGDVTAWQPTAVDHLNLSSSTRITYRRLVCFVRQIFCLIGTLRRYRQHYFSRLLYLSCTAWSRTGLFWRFGFPLNGDAGSAFRPCIANCSVPYVELDWCFLCLRNANACILRADRVRQKLSHRSNLKFSVISYRQKIAKIFSDTQKNVQLWTEWYDIFGAIIR